MKFKMFPYERKIISKANAIQSCEVNCSFCNRIDVELFEVFEHDDDGVAICINCKDREEVKFFWNLFLN